MGNGAQGPNTLATFRPDGPLAPNTAFTIRLMTAVTDTAGNPLEAEFTSTFGTATAGILAVPKW
ncbi:MAG: Ig-like domain-containing protein [Candidatus Methylomirabilis sp.]|nr:Ig-like domain-containing protein [Candidatus Methylomirabilis sp.]